MCKLSVVVVTEMSVKTRGMVDSKNDCANLINPSVVGHSVKSARSAIN